MCEVKGWVTASVVLRRSGAVGDCTSGSALWALRYALSDAAARVALPRARPVVGDLLE